MVLREVAFLSGGTRTADVVADTEVEAWMLDDAAFRLLRRRRPMVATVLLENLFGIVAGIAARLADEITGLAG